MAAQNMAKTLPTIVLVHGAWHTPKIYKPYISALETAGYEVHCPLLPTCNGTRPPRSSFSDDVTTVRTLVESLVTTAKRVFVLMHSYGGAVGSTALQDLSLSYRSAHNLPGGVVHLLYMCAYILPVGGTVAGIIKEAGYWHLFDEVLDVADDKTTFPRDPKLLFFGGLSEQEVEENMPFLVRFAVEPMEAEMAYAAWQDIPATYLFTEEDYSVPPVYQEIMTGRVRAAGVALREERYRSGHSLFLTQTEEMVRAVERACATVEL